MPVPKSDSVCRFIRQSEWSEELNKPKAVALKQGDMSVWHQGTLSKLNTTLPELRIESLTGSGQLNLTVQEYLDTAAEVSSKIGQTFQIQVEWRTEDQYVREPWREWREAHAQVEIVQGPGNNFPPPFRDLVIIKAQRKQSIIPPDPEVSDA